MTIEDKKFLSGVLHGVLAEMVDEKGNSCGLAILVHRRNLERVTPLIREEHLQAAAAEGLSVMHPYLSNMQDGTEALIRPHHTTWRGLRPKVR